MTVLNNQVKPIKIGNREIGPGHLCFIIAEAGVNHNGDVTLAEKLVYATAKAGADAVKFQTFKAEQVTTKLSPQWNLLRPLELKESVYPRLIKACNQAGIMFMSTPHGHIDSAKFLEPMVEIWKVGSGDLTNLPFLEYLGKTKKPIILSTGMATIEEIKFAVETIETTGNKNIIILHCTTNYPCPDKEANILAMQDIQKHFPDYPVGFSDHTEGIVAPLIAAAFGATVIEKHFTLDRNLPGPDQKNSLEPQELKEMVAGIRRVPNLLGSGKKEPFPSELTIAEMARKAVIASQDIPAGTKITSAMLTIKRPAKGGLAPEMIKEIIGKAAKRDIQADTQIQATDF